MRVAKLIFELKFCRGAGKVMFQWFLVIVVVRLGPLDQGLHRAIVYETVLRQWIALQGGQLWYAMIAIINIL